MAENKHSLVAYFDILGYQSFLKNNSALETAEKVFQLVKSSPKEAIKHWSNPDSLKDDQDWKIVIDSIQSLVFSDTIVVSCPIAESGPTELQIALLAGVAKNISFSMFTNGLPLRGVITMGSFIFEDTCIAGRAVVDAHSLSQTLDVAGVAFSPILSKYMDEHPLEISKGKSLWNLLHPYYLFPLKNQSELKVRVVTWNDLNKEADSTKQVREAFWKWEKDIPISADNKVHNTAKMLDFFKLHFQSKIPEKK